MNPKMQALLEKIRANRELESTFLNSAKKNFPSSTSSDAIESTDRFGKAIFLNEKQSKAVTLASSGKSCVIIGAAGTGKTTSQKESVTRLIQNGIAGILDAQDHKHLISGTPGIVVCAYTRRAVANIRKNMPADMASNCITIHKLLEYQPVYYETPDENGDMKTKMVFEATRNSHNPLPPSIHTIIFEETSMLGTDLYKEVIDACPHKPQLIFLGDIQQLPPVFGPAILGFKLLELPVVELTEVYRQALESPIISLAHRVLSGNPIQKEEIPQWKKPGLTISLWPKKVHPDKAMDSLALSFKNLYEKGAYDPEEDIILIPFNKACGTDELNKHIGNFLARKYNREVFEVIAGFNRIYLAPGEKVLYDKEDAIIRKIETNPAYSGAKPLPSSTTLDYWGYDPVRHESKENDLSDEAVDFMLQQVASQGEDRVRQCSHILTLEMVDSEQIIRVDKAADINSLLLGYCLTVHKAQGSEWRKVFFVLHNSHATMVQRELLYTGITRAKEELILICEEDTLVKGIQSQRVKGDTIEEKAEFFKGKIDAGFDLKGY